jgi:hypothetical protein
MGRPPLTPEQLRRKVIDYCRRHGVSPVPDGLPPFPSGQRETRQHRDWLSVYRALQRSALRAASAESAPGDSGVAATPLHCPVCSRILERDLAVPYARRTGGSRRPGPASLHPSCAELARLAEALGPAAVAGLGPFLWPGRTRPPRVR